MKNTLSRMTVPAAFAEQRPMKMRHGFLVGTLAGAMVMAGSNGVGQADAERKPFLLSDNGSGRSTGYAEANKIVTLGDRTHVAWLDSADGTFWVRTRTLDRKTDEWSATYTVGEAYDNHGGPALAADSKGYLHIVYYPHHHPFRYRQSLRPNDASAWGEELTFGTFCTYPTLLVASDDTLVLTCRESNKRGQPWVVNRYLKLPGKPWSGPTAIMVSDEGGYSHFQEALAWGPDHKTIHLSTRMYGGKPEHAHTVGYMRSHDLGATWEDATGKGITLPATAKACTVLDDDSEGPGGFRCGAIAVAPDGAPLILYSDNSKTPSQAWIVRLDPETGAGQRQALQPFAAKLLPGVSVAMPGGITVGGDGRLHVVLTMAPAGSNVGWGGPPEDVIYLTAPRFGADFTACAVSLVDAETPYWLPNIERPTGHNDVPAKPGIIFQGGGPGQDNTQIVSNRVYWW